MKLVAEVTFDGAYSFAYSPRPGTPAAQFADPVAPAVQQARLSRLSDVARHAVPRVRRRDGRHATARARHGSCREGCARARGAHRKQPRRQLRGRRRADRPLRRRHHHRCARAFVARRARPVRRRRWHEPHRTFPLSVRQLRISPRRSLDAFTPCDRTSLRAPAGAIAALVLALSGCASAPPAPSSTAAADAATAGVAAAMAVTAAKQAQFRGAASGCGRCGRGCGCRFARPATAVRRRDQGCEGHARALPHLAKGREGVDRNRARPVRRAVPVHGQPEPRRRRAGCLRRHDADRSDRRMEAHRQPGAADREELRVHRRRQRTDGAGREGRIHRQPRRIDAGREPAASRAQDHSGRDESRCC